MWPKRTEEVECRASDTSDVGWCYVGLKHGLFVFIVVNGGGGYGLVSET
jgi:hypothetical protein